MEMRRVISGKTKIFTIIGDPIVQALSPIVFNAMFTYDQIDALFVANRVRQENLEYAVRGLKALEISGFVVTMPHKRSILPYLDLIDPKAAAIGSVNTVVTNDEGQFVGYSTDGDGFVDNLRRQGVQIEGVTVLLFGAGGGGRSVALSLIESHVKRIYICNKYEEEALQTIDCIRTYISADITYIPFEYKAVATACKNVDLIINTTNLGMGETPSPHVELIPWKSLGRSLVVSDIVHSPQKTVLLKHAESFGHRIVLGDGMLSHQALIAYALMTGRTGSLDIMQEALGHWNEHNRHQEES